MRLYLNVSEKHMRLIFLGRFCFMYIPFFAKLKFHSHVQFSVYQLSHPVEAVLVFLFVIVLHIDLWQVG